jgi:hypothetical protein
VLLIWDALTFVRSSRRERTRRWLIERALGERRGMPRPPRLGVA